MSFVRRAIPFFVAFVFVAPGQAATKPKPEPPPAPQKLHGFLLRADEDRLLQDPDDVFPRTPAFAWERVPGVQKYEFELSTSKRFIESGRVWSGEIAGTPAISVPLALPWMTGKPQEYALYAHVRTVSTTGRSAWSTPFGFNMRADGAPLNEETYYYPGLVRWKRVEGATSYEVWWNDSFVNKRISTLTNSADEREYYTFRQSGFLPGAVRWRVRAVRSVYGGLPSGLPAVSYGPWSNTNISLIAPFGVDSQIAPFATVSEAVNATADGSDPTDPHTQTPAFLFTGAQPFLTNELYRVYVFTDKDCVNRVFTGAIVGGPAYSPRTSGPLQLPHSDGDYAKALNIYPRDGVEGSTAMSDQTKVVTNEDKTAVTTSPSSGSESEPAPAPTPSEEPAPAPSTTFTLPAAQGALVDLWDSGHPTGVYWWTVVRVERVLDWIRDDKGVERKEWIYRDTELPQEACRPAPEGPGRIRSFGKESDPALTSDNVTPPFAAPYVSGLTTDGRLVSATKEAPVFYGTPLVAWAPANGAAAYEVQWSKSAYPWSTEGTVFTFGTSALLQASGGKSLAPGTWYYRVRGLNPSIVSTIKVMTWSKEVPVVVAKPTFKLLPGAFRTFTEAGFAVTIPTKWIRVETNPSAKFYLAKGALKGVSTSTTSLRFMAQDPADKSDATGVSVSYIPTTLSHGHDAWVKAAKDTVAKQKRLVGKPFCVESRLPAGPALKCAYSFRVANSTLVESEVSFWFDRPSKTFVLALGNLRSADKANASLRLSIAKKFKIT